MHLQGENKIVFYIENTILKIYVQAHLIVVVESLQNFECG